MITRRHTLAAIAAFGGLTAVSATAAACGMPPMDGPIQIEAPFARASASAGVKSGGAYLQITNNGTAPDRLIAAKGDVAKRIELHTHLMQDGVMKMTEIEGGVELAPGESAIFKPGANHIMMMGLHAPLVKGETFCLTLVFEQAGEIMVDFPILGVGAMDAGMGHGDMNHGDMNHSETNQGNMDHSGHGTMTE